jgi:hypothetical protein
MFSLGRRAIIENTYNIRDCILHASKPLDLLRTHLTYLECLLTQDPFLVSAPHPHFRGGSAASENKIKSNPVGIGGFDHEITSHTNIYHYLK